MSKRTVFTTISPLPPGITREVVIDFLHNHQEMIDLNPLVKERHPIDPPLEVDPEEYNCIFYSLTDKITYLPGGLATGDVNYTCAFHDLPSGIQTHCRAPLGVDIRDKWTLNGTLPGEPLQPVELGLGAPLTGLYIREDVDLRCNILMTGFVKKNLKKSHATLVDRLVAKAKVISRAESRKGLGIQQSADAARPYTPSRSAPPPYPPPTQGYGSLQAGRPSPAGYPPGYGPPPQYSPPSGSDLQSHPPMSLRAPQHQHHPHPYPHHSPQPHAAHLYDLPSASTSEPSLYPQPLRIRSTSATSRESTGGHQQWPSPNQNSNINNNNNNNNNNLGVHPAAPQQTPQPQQHFDYPEMNPYATGGGGEFEPPQQPPAQRPKLVLVELPDEKSALQMSSTLNGPFIAELE